MSEPAEWHENQGSRWTSHDQDVIVHTANYTSGLYHVSRNRVRQLAALRANPFLIIGFEIIDGLLDLGAQISAMECSFIYECPIILAIPSQTVFTLRWTRLLYNNANRICKADWVMGDFWRKQKHLALANGEITERALIDNPEKHRATILVEPFGSLVDMIVGPSVGSANDLVE